MRCPMSAIRRRLLVGLVPLLVVVLSVVAGVAITALYRQADQRRQDQLQLGLLRRDLSNLSDGAFQSDQRMGGSPVRARFLMAQSTGDVQNDQLRLTADGSALATLRQLAPSIARLRLIAHEIFRIGSSGPGLVSPSGARLSQELIDGNTRIFAELDDATASYGQIAARSESRALVGSAATLALLLGAFLFFYQRSVRARRSSEDDALTDELTGLRNRRALARDAAPLIARLAGDGELMVAMFDLDGFKHYNDTFGHGAGDALLARLAGRLKSAVNTSASSYRMGGDEFCVLAEAGTEDGARIVEMSAQALSGHGDGWRISCSYGMAWLPTEAADLVEALRLADHRMYANKESRSSASTQTAAALVQVLAEQGDARPDQTDDVAQIATRTAQELGLESHVVRTVGLAAALRDIGNAAIPDSVLSKPEPLDHAEQQFVRRHTVVGERILMAAPALAGVATIVRSTHERIDGNGYPDGLEGSDIPIASRIVAVADAFDSMISQRPHRPAMSDADAIAELRRCAGTQFDDDVLRAFLTVTATSRRTTALAASRSAQ
jgi:diguanylate cyclase (GGDEF)-like protein